MLAPHELKTKTFTKSMRGYNPQEVDEYIDFLIESYTDIYRENNELERKLKIVVASLEELKDEEESIRSTLIKSQQLAEKIVEEANEKADVITSSIKTRCDEIISEFRKQIIADKNDMWTIRTKILDFKKSICELYREHLGTLINISINDLDEIVIPDENKIIKDIFADLKNAVKKSAEMDEQQREDEDLNTIPEKQERKVSDDEYLEMLAGSDKNEENNESSENAEEKNDTESTEKNDPSADTAAKSDENKQ